MQYSHSNAHLKFDANIYLKIKKSNKVYIVHIQLDVKNQNQM
jgi:hypothetical protein